MIESKRRGRTLLGITMAGTALSVAGVALPQGEVVVGGTMSVEPSTVEPGGSYVISNDPGSPCLLGEVSGDTGGIRPGAWFATPDEAGNWSVTIEVPESGPPDPMGNPTPFPPGDYEQHAFCQQPLEATGIGAAGGQQQAEFSYEPVDVTVVAAAEEEPTEPTTPSAPPAAEPTEASPDFTG